MQPWRGSDSQYKIADVKLSSRQQGSGKSREVFPEDSLETLRRVLGFEGWSGEEGVTCSRHGHSKGGEAERSGFALRVTSWCLGSWDTSWEVGRRYLPPGGFVRRDISWIPDAMQGSVSWLAAVSSQEGAIERRLGVEDLWGEEVDVGQGFGVAVIFSGQTWS